MTAFPSLVPAMRRPCSIGRSRPTSLPRLTPTKSEIGPTDTAKKMTRCPPLFFRQAGVKPGETSSADKNKREWIFRTVTGLGRLICAHFGDYSATLDVCGDRALARRRPAWSSCWIFKVTTVFQEGTEAGAHGGGGILCSGRERPAARARWTLPDLLRHVPGRRSPRSTPTPGQSRIRGFNSRYSNKRAGAGGWPRGLQQRLFSGVLLGSEVDLIRADTSSASTRWSRDRVRDWVAGANAVSGVINVITRTRQAPLAGGLATAAGWFRGLGAQGLLRYGGQAGSRRARIRTFAKYSRFRGPATVRTATPAPTAGRAFARWFSARTGPFGPSRTGSRYRAIGSLTGPCQSRQCLVAFGVHGSPVLSSKDVERQRRRTSWARWRRTPRQAGAGHSSPGLLRHPPPYWTWVAGGGLGTRPTSTCGTTSLSTARHDPCGRRRFPRSVRSTVHADRARNGFRPDLVLRDRPVV